MTSWQELGAREETAELELELARHSYDDFRRYCTILGEDGPQPMEEWWYFDAPLERPGPVPQRPGLFPSLVGQVGKVGGLRKGLLF